MHLLLLLVLGQVGDAAKAGAAYDQGLGELRKERYVTAVLKFQEAIKHQSKETHKLLYRDNRGRHKDPYYPHYYWAQARIRQAEREAVPEKKRALLQEAISHLVLTIHPKALALQNEAKVKVARIKTPASPPPPSVDPFAAPYAALKEKVDDLCARERFEEALRMVAAEDKLFKSHAKEKNRLVGLIGNRRKGVLESYQRILTLALRNLSSTDPTRKPGSVLPALEPARIPPWVQRVSAPPFRWLESFISLYEKEVENVRMASSLKPEEVVRTAEAFEAAAGRALAADSFVGFRAARNVARSVRQARLGALESKDEEAAKAILVSSERAGERWEGELRGRIERSAIPQARDEMKKYLLGELVTEGRQVREIRGRFQEKAQGRDRLREAIRTAEGSLLDPDTMADAAALREIGGKLSNLQAHPLFTELSRGERARAFFAHALTEGVGAFLEGNATGEVRKRCGPLASKGYALDGKVDQAWRERLSPKLLAVLDEIKRQ